MASVIPPRNYQARDLIKTAGFVARRHQKHIGATFDSVCQLFVVADEDSDLVMELLTDIGQALLERFVTATENDKLDRMSDQIGQGIEYQVDTLLFGKTTDCSDQRNMFINRQAELALELEFVENLL